MQREKNRCSICNKTIKLFFEPISLCKCDLFFCKQHKNKHACTFNFKTEQKRKLKKKNLKIEAKKIEKI